MSVGEFTDLTEQQITDSPRVGMFRIVFGVLLHQDFYGAAAMLVAEYIAETQRLEHCMMT